MSFRETIIVLSAADACHYRERERERGRVGACWRGVGLWAEPEK